MRPTVYCRCGVGVARGMLDASMGRVADVVSGREPIMSSSRLKAFGPRLNYHHRIRAGIQTTLMINCR